MCLFIYTLPQECGHTYFQNVSECPIARGIAPTNANRLDSTLNEPKFLFDTSRSRTHTPDFYSRTFDCKKRKAIRPAPTLCDKCVRKMEERKGRRREGDSLASASLPGEAVGRGESSGSLVALVGGAGPSASSTTSSLNNTSGASTPRSFWKMARPSEIV